MEQHSAAHRPSCVGATGLEPATSGVTGRHGATGYNRLRPGITGYRRRFFDSRTGCDRLQPASTRHSLCGRCVVNVLSHRTTTWRSAPSSSTDRRPSYRVAAFTLRLLVITHAEAAVARVARTSEHPIAHGPASTLGRPEIHSPKSSNPVPRGCQPGTNWTPPGCTACASLPSAFVTSTVRLGQSSVAICVPSGDQAVPSLSAPEVIGCGLDPSAFMIQMSPPVECVCSTKAIREPSGLQSGSWSFGTGSNVSSVWPLPSAFITQTWLMPVRLLWKTILLPSGDQTGNPSFAVSVVSCVNPVPSLFTTKTFGSAEAGSRPLKTIWLPSGEMSGNTPNVVSCRLSVPSCFISQMPPGPHQAIDSPSAE